MFKKITSIDEESSKVFQTSIFSRSVDLQSLNFKNHKKIYTDHYNKIQTLSQTNNTSSVNEQIASKNK